MNGLLTQKKETPVPHVGAKIRYMVTHEVSQRTGTPWTKIRNCKPDQPGQLYEIQSIAATGRTDAHGNVSFNLDIEPVESSDGQPATHTPGAQQNASTGQAGSFTGYSDTRSHRIERQHSQEMALRYTEILVTKNPPLYTVNDIQKMIAEWTDAFQRDLDNQPNP